jgi:F0F1-type ATP synthase membrane subunit c/vacuolar-type H+-ATPase subunit K
VTSKVEARQDEVTRYHRSTSVLVLVMIAFVTLLTLLVWLGVISFDPRGSDPTLLWALRITIVIFGLGAVALRRTRFSAARLQDIASLRGTTGLLSTLQQTTILVAALGEAIAVMGFVMMVMTGDRYDMLRAGVIAVAVLFYAYPRRSAWEREVELTRQGGAGGGDGNGDAAEASPTKGTFA